MKYVLDLNVATKWVLPEPDSAKSRVFRDEFSRGLHDLISPDILPIEVGHALTRAERQGRINQSESLNLWADIMTTPPRFLPYLPLMPRALTLSSQARIGVYDCVYVALAEHEQCRVVTADQRLLNSFPAHTISLASLP
jgi:predicted nucleic acid-binding protein